MLPPTFIKQDYVKNKRKQIKTCSPFLEISNSGFF